MAGLGRFIEGPRTPARERSEKDVNEAIRENAVGGVSNRNDYLWADVRQGRAAKGQVGQIFGQIITCQESRTEIGVKVAIRLPGEVCSVARIPTGCQGAVKARKQTRTTPSAEIRTKIRVKTGTEAAGETCVEAGTQGFTLSTGFASKIDQVRACPQTGAQSFIFTPGCTSENNQTSTCLQTCAQGFSPSTGFASQDRQVHTCAQVSAQGFYRATVFFSTRQTLG